MTFYEAALEVLKAETAPLHVEKITELALERNLLSHVGRVPEQIMRARLLAMSRREGRDVVVVEPEVFALAAWGRGHDEAAARATEPERAPDEPPLRPPERTPLSLSEAKALREAERGGRFEQEDREARARSRKRRRKPRPDESVGEALEGILLELGGGPIDGQYVVDALEGQADLPEDFPRTLEAVVELARTVNRTRAEAGEAPLFAVEGDRLERLTPEPPAEAAIVPPAVVRPTRREETAKEVARSLVPGLRKMAPEAVESLALALAEHFGLDDLKVAKRSAKGSPLFTGFVRLGVGQLRLAVRVLVSGRNVRPDDVDEVRADLEHYSAAAGVVVTAGEVDRAARSRAEDMSKKPVVLVDGERLAGLCIEAGIGVRVRLEEVLEPDPTTFQRFGKGS